MKLLVLSDLHVEQAPFEPPSTDADVVVLAGDVHNGAAAVAWARETFPATRIVQIAGNHEFYDGEYRSVLAGLRDAAARAGIHFLENEAVVIDGVRFLGCTLWTDHRALEAPGRRPSLDRRAAMEASRRANPDYFAIRYGEERRPFAPEDAAALHDASRDWLAEQLRRGFDGPTVVVTHHLPSWRSVNPAFATSGSNVAFVSDLDDLVEQADLWIHGHTHASCAYRAGRAKVVCNPRGYPAAMLGGVSGKPATPGSVRPAFENPEFDPALVVALAPG